MDNIILVGAGGHATVCIDVIEQEGRFRIAGLIERKPTAVTRCGYPIIGIDDDLKTLRQSFDHALVSVGQIKTPNVRMKLFKILKSLGYSLPVITSPVAYVTKRSSMGEGTIIMHGAIINAGAKIGDNCIINNRSLVEHDATVGAHCHIATGAILNGEVNVGEGSFVGSSAVIKQGISIGKNCVVGAGCILKKDLPDFQMVQ